MSKTFTIARFNSNVSKYEAKYNMKKAEKATFRTAMLYRCLVREIVNSKKEN
ncbi:MAG: hypothetical protein J6S85_14325 [Methanobrevibacter sp.]|nr:hypothetical protein [Methanobrevibacter sp.]